MTEHEKEVLQRLKQGDEPVWQALADTVQPRLERAIRRVVSDEESVQDLLSETLVILVNVIDKLENPHDTAS